MADDYYWRDDTGHVSHVLVSMNSNMSDFAS